MVPLENIIKTLNVNQQIKSKLNNLFNKLEDNIQKLSNNYNNIKVLS